MNRPKNVTNECRDSEPGAYLIPVFRRQVVKEGKGLIAAGPINGPVQLCTATGLSV